MYMGQNVAYRLQQPNQYDNGWRVGIILAKNNKGYTLSVLLNPQFDRDIQPTFTGVMVVNNRKEGEDVGQFTYLDTLPGLDGEKPFSQSEPVAVPVEIVMSPKDQEPEAEKSTESEGGDQS